MLCEKEVVRDLYNKVNVLILVLMEYALRVVRDCTHLYAIGVLILVLMEYALRASQATSIVYSEEIVLILVLMEYALRVIISP